MSKCNMPKKEKQIKQVQELLAEKRYKQKEIAEMTGTSDTFVSDVKNGRYTSDGHPVMDRILRSPFLGSAC